MQSFRFCPACGRRLAPAAKKPLCRFCGRPVLDRPRPAAAAVVQNENDEILLVERGTGPGRGRWALPTGFIEPGETPEQAVLRELGEETGLEGRILDLVGVYCEPLRAFGEILLIAYNVEVIAGRLRAGSDAAKARFFKLTRLPRIPFRSHNAVLYDELNRKYRQNYAVTVLKSKITEAHVTGTVLHYRGSMGIDRRILDAAGIVPGEKVQVLNYRNGERLETYIIEEKAGSGRFVLYGPASLRGRIGDKLCILSYALATLKSAATLRPKVVVIGQGNRIKKIQRAV